MARPLSAPPDLSLRLRRETRDLHERLERTFALPASLTEYRRQLLVMHGFVAPLEGQLLLQRSLPEELLEGRAKVPLLDADLERLDVALGPLPRPLCADLPRIENPMQATGVMYVLEGSTLGGQMIARHVRATLGVDVPCSYYQSYGPEVPSKWEQFRQYLRRIETPDEQRVVVMSARETFEKLESWSKT